MSRLQYSMNSRSFSARVTKAVSSSKVKEVFPRNCIIPQTVCAYVVALISLLGDSWGFSLRGRSQYGLLHFPQRKSPPPPR